MERKLRVKDRFRAVLALVWRAAVLGLLVWNLHATREAQRAAEEARAAAVIATQAVDELAARVDEALGDDDAAAPAELDQGT